MQNNGNNLRPEGPGNVNMGQDHEPAAPVLPRHNTRRKVSSPPADDTVQPEKPPTRARGCSDYYHQIQAALALLALVLAAAALATAYGKDDRNEASSVAASHALAPNRSLSGIHELITLQANAIEELRRDLDLQIGTAVSNEAERVAHASATKHAIAGLQEGIAANANAITDNANATSVDAEAIKDLRHLLGGQIEAVASIGAAHDGLAAEVANWHLAPDQLLSGMTCQTVSAVTNARYSVHVPNYGNNPANFRPTELVIHITTMLPNSKIMIQAQFAMRPSTQSHYYVDIRRSKNDDGVHVSLAAQASGDHGGQADTDGMVSGYPGVHDVVSAPTRPIWLDTPNVPAGTKLTYVVYVGLWSAGYMYIGAYVPTGVNDRTPEVMIAQEIVQN